MLEESAIIPSTAALSDCAASGDFQNLRSRTPQDEIAPPSVARTHPLDRSAAETRDGEAENQRIRLAWAKLVWLLSFLGVLLAISYLVPYIAEQTQYAITRGKQRAEHDFAESHIGGSPL